jgi:hypothetical protein
MRPYRVANVDPYVLKPEAERALKPGDAFRECAKDCPESVLARSKNVSGIGRPMAFAVFR